MLRSFFYFLSSLSLILSLGFSKVEARTELIIFSFDRPMQLYALLESVNHHVKDLKDISIICRASNPRYRLAYGKLHAYFPHLKWVWQGETPKEDFKPLLNSILIKSTADFVLFAVDDMIVTDYIDLKICEKTLKESGELYGFYLRLGKNINLVNSKTIPIPKFKSGSRNNILTWAFDPLVDYWGYPHTVDMTLFRKEQILNTFLNLNFSSPNTLEAAWALMPPLLPLGACFDHSKVLNIPANLVQEDWTTQHLNQFSTKQMLNMFLNGRKIDVSLFYQLDNRSPHEYKKLNIIKRNPN